MVCTPNKEALLALIQPDLKLTKEFLKHIYSFELSYSGFSEQAIAALEAAGFSRARACYDIWVTEYETVCKAEMKEAAKWYSKECEKQWEKKQKGSEAKRIIQAEVELLKQKRKLLMQKSQILTNS